MELPKDWEAIVEAGIRHHAEHGVTIDAISDAVERCYALTQKPRKELTDAEIDKLWPCGYYRATGDYSAPRNLIAAHEAKQREPETVTFRAARSKSGDIAIYNATDDLGDSNGHWEWLDLDGKPQTFEVKV